MTPIIVPHPTTGEALPPFLTAREASHLLGWDEERVANACRRGELPALPQAQRGVAWAIPTMQLLRLLGFDPTVHGQPAAGCASAMPGPPAPPLAGGTGAGHGSPSS